VTERKPPAQSWQGFIEQAIERARKEGQFENVEGMGKPLAGLDEPYDENWWIKSKLRRENLSATPEPLTILLRIKALREELPLRRSESDAKECIRALNREIGLLNAAPAAPGVRPIAPLDEEDALREWKSGPRT
jgi:hypothetical protein